MRVGIFGGSFDPVHNAHLALARIALEQLHLDRLLWIPAGQPWQKMRPLASAPHRIAMLSLAIADEPRYVLEESEVNRAGPTYTADTVRELQTGTPPAEWFLIIGQDQYTKLHSWREWQELLRRVTLAVASRDGAAIAAGTELAATPHRMAILPLPPMPISSTEIRRRLAHGEPIADIVPPSVARYIARHHLYS